VYIRKKIRITEEHKMKRSDLKDGGQYVGPGSKCYEIVDMTPGWRIDHSGAWVQDDSTRNRHMPGRGTVAYRSNLAVRVYVTEADGTKRRTVIDPRKLSGPWADFQEAFEDQCQERKRADEVVKLARRALREGHHRPSASDQYVVRPDGQSVTIPIDDLRALASLPAEQFAGSGS
jgi:hypothetical protein